MNRRLSCKSVALITCITAIGVLAPLDAKAGPIDFFRSLFHHNKKTVQQIQRHPYRHLTQAGITVAPPTMSKLYKFQEHPAF